jgi:outer membrane protein OmpA-like peptidoglycan-associated protein
MMLILPLLLYQQMKRLCPNRAKRIFDYLLFKGVDESRLSTVSFEGQFPLVKGPKFDRRVEVEIIAI